MNRIIVLAATAFALQASAQTTTMQVPQGSADYPTIGQIECLEEESSGRYCAATWECGDGSSGTLWRDMEDHNGQRSVVPDHPIANRRDCVVEVDGKASAQWFRGFRPQGRDGSIVGLANATDALRPVQEAPEITGTMDDAPSGSMLAFILERHDTTIQEVVELACLNLEQHSGPNPLTDCLNSHSWPGGDYLNYNFGGIIYALALTPATPSRQCVAEVLEEAYCPPPEWRHNWDCEDGGANAAALHFFTGYGFASSIAITDFLARTLSDLDHWGYDAPPVEALRSRCGPLALQEIEQIGLNGVLQPYGDSVRPTWPEPDDEQ